jgi:hypothetical protein
MRIGCTLMTEQSDPRDLVRYAARAEQVGFGAGENLNEHVVGAGWPPGNVRQKMLAEAVTIIEALFDGGYVNHHGDHYRVDSARLWDLPDARVPVGVAVSGDQSVDLFAPLVDHLVAVEPAAGLVSRWRGHSPRGDRVIGQLPQSWAPDRDEAVNRTHQQFRWFGGGWKVNAELPGTATFAGAPSSSGPRTLPLPFRVARTSAPTGRTGSSTGPNRSCFPLWPWTVEEARLTANHPVTSHGSAECA